MPIALSEQLDKTALHLAKIGVNISAYTSSRIKLLYLYGYYHYFGANDSSTSELESAIFLTESYTSAISSIFQIDEEPVTHEVVGVVFSDNGSLLEPLLAGEVIWGLVQEFTNPDISASPELRSAIESVNDDERVVFKIVTNEIPDPKTKAEIKRFLAKLDLHNENYSADIIFGDDILEEINDVENPKPFVKEDVLTLIDPYSLSFYGKERSFFGAVSAKSLRELYLRQGTKGLFGSNLRYYIKSLRIDASIEESIKKRPEEFWYMNNGLIITCSEYKISGNNLVLSNFSIVNGGQTTNIIGNSDFTEDFAVCCKVIKNRYKSQEANDAFLSAVAESTNAQKPIKAKDLIANRPEQKKLKASLADLGIFVQIKRGDRPIKSKFPDPWQITTNDDIGQLVLASLYQDPSLARSSIKKIYETSKLYHQIFERPLAPEFVKDLVILKACFNYWISLKSAKGKKAENYPRKFFLSRNSYLYYIGIIGLLSKTCYNSLLRQCLRNVYGNSAEVQYFIEQRDIGFGHILPMGSTFDSTKEVLSKLFALIESSVMGDAYITFQKYRRGIIDTTTAAFAKDRNIYSTDIVRMVFNNKDLLALAEGILYRPSPAEKQRAISRFVPVYHPGLREDLTNYRVHQSRIDGVKASDIFDDKVLTQIVKNKPLSVYELSALTKMTPESIDRYGRDILSLIKVYEEDDTK